jgi:hypothetical protein
MMLDFMISSESNFDLFRTTHKVLIMIRRFSTWLCGGPIVLLLAVQSLGAADLFSPTASVASVPVGDKDPIVQQEQKQQQLRNTTRRVGDQLEIIVAEFERNGIAGEDVSVLRAIRGVLDHLSERDMVKVIEFLQQSRGASDSKISGQTVTEAYAAQKSIIVQLHQLVMEYQRQQALYEISLRLKELAGRQTANMWLGVALAKSAEGKSSFTTYDENQKISLRYQQAEQNPLRDEVEAILKRLGRLADEITDGSAADRPKAALEQGRKGGLCRRWNWRLAS